jgi:hypothetical protein
MTLTDDADDNKAGETYARLMPQLAVCLDDLLPLTDD